MTRTCKEEAGEYFNCDDQRNGSKPNRRFGTANILICWKGCYVEELRLEIDLLSALTSKKVGLIGVINITSQS